MKPPAEHEVSPSLARALIETQFPALAPASVHAFGSGWDNTAYLVNQSFVFRFPRRAVAVPLIVTEAQVMPAVAPTLPLPVSVPTFVGSPAESYPWPFAGHRLVPGRTGCRARLDDDQRAPLAGPLAGFLRALHAFPLDRAEAAGAPLDTIGRLDIVGRAPRMYEHARALAQAGLEVDVRLVERVIAGAEQARKDPVLRLVHGDFYVRHLLLDDRGQAAGVIDWGDLHRGARALDFGVAHSFLPPAARGVFRDAYGPIDESEWRLARFRALYTSLTLAVHALEGGDPDLRDEMARALGYLATAS